MTLRKWIQFEYIAGFLMTFIVYIHLDFSILYFFLLLFLPDLSMLGYLVNKDVGAKIYNLVHHLSLPTVIITLSILLNLTTYLMFSSIWIAHIFLDRALGYGLKYQNSFKETHLQKIT